MIILCGTETSATIRWSPNAVPLPCFAECGWGGCNGHANRDRGPRWQFKSSNPFACPLNPLTPYSATQWGEECSGGNVAPLVSVLQTRSSQMFVFKISNYFQHNAFITDVLSRLKITCLESERKEAKQQYQDHLQSYVRDSLGRPMEKLNVSKMFLSFLLTDWNRRKLSNTTAYQMTFSYSCFMLSFNNTTTYQLTFSSCLMLAFKNTKCPVAFKFYSILPVESHTKKYARIIYLLADIFRITKELKLRGGGLWCFPVTEICTILVLIWFDFLIWLYFCIFQTT